MDGDAMMEVILISVGWLICSVVAYLLFRFAWRKGLPGQWTVDDRMFVLVTSICGPLSVLVAGLVCLAFMVDGDKPARW